MSFFVVVTGFDVITPAADTRMQRGANGGSDGKAVLPLHGQQLCARGA